MQEQVKVFYQNEWRPVSEVAKIIGMPRRTLRERRNYFINKYGPMEKWTKEILAKLFRAVEKQPIESTRCESRDCDNIPRVSMIFRGYKLCPNCAVKAIFFMMDHKAFNKVHPRLKNRRGYY